MPTCSDCVLSTKKTEGECIVNGPVSTDRDAGRCPSPDVSAHANGHREALRGTTLSTGSGCPASHYV